MPEAFFLSWLLLIVFTETEFERVVFLYHLEQGQAAASYGLNVASLAGLPNCILQVAHRKSKQLEEEVLRTQSERPASGSQNGHNSVLELLTLLNQTHSSSVSQVLRNFFSKTPVGAC